MKEQTKNSDEIDPKFSSVELQIETFRKIWFII